MTLLVCGVVSRLVDSPCRSKSRQYCVWRNRWQGRRKVERYFFVSRCEMCVVMSICNMASRKFQNRKKKSHIMEERYCCRKFRLFSNCLDGVLRLKISCWSYLQQWDPLGSQCDFKLKSEFFGFPSKVDFFFDGFHRPMILRRSQTLEDDF